MKRAILIPPIVGLFTGFLISFLFTPRYTSEAKMALRQSGVPSGYIVSTSVIIDEFGYLSRLALSATMMRPAVRSLNLIRPGQQEDQLIADIRANVIVTPRYSPDELAPTFYVKYSAHDPARAQQVCQMVTTLIVNARPEIRAQVSSSTTEFLRKQLDDAKARVMTIEKELTKYRKKGKHRSVEEEPRYRSLLRDYEDAKKLYADLLRKRQQAEISTTLESEQERVKAQVLEPATLPEAPDFPNRFLCAVAGFVVGLAIAVTLALIRRSASAS
jgi:uncharacterized protein involved in exopolysaccharide biosynthesis